MERNYQNAAQKDKEMENMKELITNSSSSIKELLLKQMFWCQNPFIFLKIIEDPKSFCIWGIYLLIFTVL